MNASTEVQYDNFARQLSALEKLLVISHAKLSVGELHQNLKVCFQIMYIQNIYSHKFLKKVKMFCDRIHTPMG